ncbi:hypothetical protein MKX01_004095 [Papaver californicum]|nr:hypothetical protein MKX01_004095 [Papaver californicum]
MAICSKVHICLVMLIVMVGSVTSKSNDDFHSCRGMEDMLEKCEKYLSTEFGKTLVAPSGDCCAAVRSADVQCLWKYMTPAMKEYLSPEKLTYVSEYCSTPPRLHGSKSGSYKVHV